MFVNIIPRSAHEDVASARVFPGAFEMVLHEQTVTGDPAVHAFAAWVFARRSDKGARARWEKHKL